MKSRAKWLVVLFTAVLLFAAVFLASCKPSDPDGGNPDTNSERMEAESSSVVLEPYTGKGASTAVNSASPNKDRTSNRYISKLVKNSTVSWFFDADIAGTTTLRISIANGKTGAAAMPVNTVLSVSVNDEAIVLPSLTISAASQYLDDWNVLTLPNTALKAGTNIVKLKITSDSNTVNVDYLDIERIEGTKITAHTHDWKNADNYVEASCETDGDNWRACKKTSCGYTYHHEHFEPLGHIYENWDFVELDDGKTYMGEVCNRKCGAYKGSKDDLVDVTGVENLGVVVDSFETIRAKAATKQRNVETVFSAAEAFAGLPGGLNNEYAGGYKEAPGNGSDIGHIANISNPGNYVQFDIFVSEATTADIGLRMANVRTNGSQILELNPFGDYIDFRLYNGSVKSSASGVAGEGVFQPEVVSEVTHLSEPMEMGDHTKYKFYNEPVANYDDVCEANRQNGIKFNYDYVKFPGTPTQDWYNWKFVLVQDVQLEEGLNTIVFRPNPKDGNKSIPNTAGIYIYTENDVVTPDAGIEGATVESNDYAPAGLTVKNTFEAVMIEDEEQQLVPTGEYKFAVGEIKTNSELIIDFTTTVAIENLSEYLNLTFNGERIRLRIAAGEAGSYRLALPLSSLETGINQIKADIRQAGITIDGVSFYTDSAITKAYDAMVENSKALGAESLWDAGYNQTLQPKMTFGIAEDGVRSKTDGTLDTGGDGVLADGCCSNYNGTNSLTWTFTTDASATIDFAIRTACSNWQNGNTNMIDLEKYFTITIDGIAVNLSGLDLITTGDSDWHNWANIVIEDVNLTAGEHTIIMKGKGGSFPNTNLLWAYSDDDVTFTKPSDIAA